MRAREVVGKARPRLGMLRTHQGLRVPQGCLSPQQGWRVTPPCSSSVGCASRCSCRPPPAARLEGRGGWGSLGGGLAMRVRVMGSAPGGAVLLPSLPHLSRQTHA